MPWLLGHQQPWYWSLQTKRPNHWEKLPLLTHCRLFGAKPLPEPMLTYCQVDPYEQNLVKFESKLTTFHPWKCTCKFRLWNCPCMGRCVNQTRPRSACTHICIFGNNMMACMWIRKSCNNYINPGYGLSLVDTLWNASSYRQPLEQEGNPMT